MKSRFNQRGYDAFPVAEDDVAENWSAEVVSLPEPGPVTAAPKARVRRTKVQKALAMIQAMSWQETGDLGVALVDSNPALADTLRQSIAAARMLMGAR